MKNKNYSIIILIFFYLVLTINLFAGITGKIAGKVTDLQTGEELIGINVIIEGTSLGAATNIDGNYVINNVEPGTYTLIFSGVGYQKKIITNVKVSSDFTTRIDIQLVTEAVGLEAIIVEATRPMVRKDLTSSHTVIDNTQIEALPVESVDQLLALQAGITKGAGGELHIRGGRSTEIAYNVNGVSSVNPYDYGRTVQISTNAIQELSVVSGTFNAEYGNALSGVVNAITKEGGTKYTGSISYYTGDYLSSHKNIFMNIGAISPVNNQVIEGTIGGPIPYLNNLVSFFFSGRYNDDKGYYYGLRQHTIYDSVYRNPANPNDIKLSLTGDNSYVSMNPSKDLNLTGKFTFKPMTTLKINYDIVLSNSNYKTYNHELKYNPDANYNRFEKGLINSLEIRQIIGSNTFYSLKGSHSFYDFKRYLFPLLDQSGNEVNFRPGMDLSNLKADPRYQPSHKNFKLTPYTFLSGGTLNEHFYQRSNSSELRFDLTSQLTTEHEVKLGLKGKYDVLDYQYFTVLRDTINFKSATIPPVNSLYHDLYSREPVQFSAYIQDKMEYTNMIINAGLRFDYLNPKAKYAPDIFKPRSNLQQAKAKSILSPRLGISFPITDRGIIHFSYGHFYQLPPFRYLYTNPDFKMTGSTPTYGNANLNPEKNVTYEMGLQQQLSETIAFNITGFYKDVRDLLALQEIRISTSESYYKYVNKDYANIKGITFSLTKRKLPDDLFGATLDYTYQIAEGNEIGASSFFLDLSSGRQSEKIPVPLNWDQNHTLNGTVTFGNYKDWVLSIVGSISTGLPYTPQLMEQEIYLKDNSERKPISMNVDMLFEKSFDFKVVVATLFVKVFNLFDTLNERFVYDDTGRATYTLETSKGGAQETNRLAQLIPGLKSADEYFIRPNYYSAPREVRLGLSLEF